MREFCEGGDNLAFVFWGGDVKFCDGGNASFGMMMGFSPTNNENVILKREHQPHFKFQFLISHFSFLILPSSFLISHFVSLRPFSTTRATLPASRAWVCR